MWERWQVIRRHPAIALGAGAVVLALLILALRHPGGDAKYITAPVTRGTVIASVEATGTINPLTTVPVGSYVSGTAKYIFADFNTRVHAGQVLAQLDPAVYEARLVEARGNLQKAMASLHVAETTIEAENANAAKSEADRAYAEANARRVTELQKKGLAPLDQRELSQSTFTQAEATLRASRSRAEQARAQVEQARAEITAMTGALKEAESNLSYTTILSPADGVVVARNITVGQSVAASLQAPNLFTIAEDLKRMRVYAKTDESDTGFIRIGGEATFQVDAFPTETFHGRVSAIRLNAYIVQNVVTYDTIIDFENPDERLLPGETAYVTISTGRADNAVLVPNAAISFTPDLDNGELQRLYRKYNIPPAAYTSHHDNQQVVWRAVTGRGLEPIAIKAGLSDSTSTQLLGGNLREGDLLATASVNGPSSSQQGRAPIPNRAGGGRR